MMPMRFRDVQKKKKEVKESAGRRAQYESESEYETRIRQLAETLFRAAEQEKLQGKSLKTEIGSPKFDLHNRKTK